MECDAFLFNDTHTTNFLAQKNVCFSKSLGFKNFKLKKYLGSKILGFKDSVEKYLGPKKFYQKIVLSKNVLSYTTFLTHLLYS